jgi:hypothetical protein
MTLRSAAEVDRECHQRRMLRMREAKAKVKEFLALNLTPAEAAEVIDDLHHQVANDLRRKQWHREARP